MKRRGAFLPSYMAITFLVGFWSTELFACALCLAPIFFILRPINDDIRQYKVDFIDIGFMMIVIFEMLIFPFSTNLYNSFLQLFFLWNLFIYYILVKFIFLEQHKRNTVILFISAYSFCICVLTIFQYLAFSLSLSFEGFGGFTDFKHLYKPFWTFSNEWATILILLLPFSLSSYVVLRSSGNLRIYAWASGVIVIANIFAILISYSRGAYVALIAFVVFSCLLFYVYQMLRRGQMLTYVAAMIVAIVLAAIPIRESAVTTIMLTKTESQKRSLAGRLDIWNNMTLKRKSTLLGVGSNNFALEYSKVYNLAKDQPFTQRASNTLLKTQMEKGYLGLLTYAAFILFVIIHVRRCFTSGNASHEKTVTAILMAGTVAMMVRELSFSSLFENETVLLLFVTNLALFPRGDSFAIAMTRKRKVLFRFVLLSFGIIFLFAALLQLFSERCYSDSISQIKRKDQSAALSSSNSSLRFCSFNPQFFAFNGLLNYRMATMGGDSTQSVNIADQEQYLSNAIERYQIALSLNPFDAAFMHNLGWLKMITYDTASAEKYFEKATKADANCALYHFSLGKLYELKADSTRMMAKYSDAILCDLEILDSRFFSDFKNRYPMYATQMIKVISDSLKNSNGPMGKAKLGKLYLNEGQSLLSKQLLEEVSKELPSLNRVWYNLGVIYEAEGDSVSAKKMYLRASFLDAEDFLPTLKLADYYQFRKNESSAVDYYKLTLRNLSSTRSDHSNMTYPIYRVGGYANDIITQDLMLSLKPKVDIQKICLTIASFYKNKGNEKMCQYYTKLSDRNEIFVTDIQ